MCLYALSLFYYSNQRGWHFFSRLSSDGWIHWWASEVLLSDLSHLPFSSSGVPLDFLSCHHPLGSQSPISFPLMGMWEGVSHPLGALRRKSSLFLAKTGHLSWNTLVYSHTPQVSFLSYQTPLLVGKWGRVGDPVLLYTAWDLHFSFNNWECRHF